MEKVSKYLINIGTFFTGAAIFVKFFTYTVDSGDRVIIFNKLIGNGI